MGAYKRIKNFLGRKFIIYSLVGGLSLGVANCGPEEQEYIANQTTEEQTTEDASQSDADEEISNVEENNENTNPLNIPAGKVGECIKVEIYPGYNSCIMDQAQALVDIPRTAQIESALTTEELPLSINHKGYIDSNCPEVHDQGNCGWCVAHAVTAAMEALECKNIKGERISEPHLWYLGNGDVNDCKKGWVISSAMKTAKNNKLVPSSVWTYSDIIGEMSKNKPSDEVLNSKGIYSIDEYIEIQSKDIQAIKSALAKGYNVVYSVPIFCDTGWLYSNSKGYPDQNYKKNIIAPTIKDIKKCEKDLSNFKNCKASAKSFCLSGYHAFLIIGYNEDTQQFLLRNSWGTDWANKGYSNISYDYLKKFGEGGYYPKKIICFPGDYSCFNIIAEGKKASKFIACNEEGDGWTEEICWPPALCYDPLFSIISCPSTVGPGCIYPEDCPLQCIDNDGDGWGSNCLFSPDCDDNNKNIHPNATELCDILDNDCDGKTDEDLEKIIYCGYNSNGTQKQICENGVWKNVGVCDDPDQCKLNETKEYYTGTKETKGVGECKPGIETCVGEPAEWQTTKKEVTPTTDVCNNKKDDDCDGKTDENCNCNECSKPEEKICESDGKTLKICKEIEPFCNQWFKVTCPEEYKCEKDDCIPICQCTDWEAGGSPGTSCGKGGCKCNEFYEKRTCTPEKCDIEEICSVAENCAKECIPESKDVIIKPNGSCDYKDTFVASSGGGCIDNSWKNDLWVGMRDTCTNQHAKFRTYLKFSLSCDIPENAKIGKAILAMSGPAVDCLKWCSGSGCQCPDYPLDLNLEIYRITEPWGGWSSNYNSNWDGQPASISTGITQKVDIFWDDYCKVNDLNAEQFDITSLVKYWYEHPAENYGLMIKVKEEGIFTQFCRSALGWSSSEGTGGNFPHLKIYYTK